MRLLFACLCIAATAFAQGGRGHALGGFPHQASPIGTYPLISPTTAPALGGLPVNSRPLGGLPAPGARRVKGTYGSGYIGPIFYVPSASDYASADFWNSYNSPAPVNGGYGVQPPPLQPPPVIINQYFDSKHQPVGSEEVPPVSGDNPGGSPPDTAAKPGDPLAAPVNYYLIEYKDHSIYTALAYWVEGDTLHYVTTQNTHNQASLNLIDLDKTYKLNQDQNVPFSIPGR